MSNRYKKNNVNRNKEEKRVLLEKKNIKKYSRMEKNFFFGWKIIITNGNQGRKDQKKVKKI